LHRTSNCLAQRCAPRSPVALKLGDAAASHAPRVGDIPFADLIHFEVDPVSWTPEHLCSRSSRWRRRDQPIPRNSVARWSNWSAPGARRRSWRKSLNRRRSGNRCREAGVRPSMGSVGDAYDNAMRELLRHVGMRASRPASVQDAGRGAHRGVRIHRGLLQPPPSSFLDQVSLSDRLRASRRPIPTHTSQAAVLAAVKDKPSGRPPSGAVLDRRCARRPHLRAGRDGRMAPPGAEQKNGPPNRRAKCPQTRYPDPNPTTLHETGASP
jgi:hypothetical protein